MRHLLAILVALLAIGVGALHFALDFVLFRGNFFGFPSPPPGASRPSPPPGPPPSAIGQLIGPRLPPLFLANFIVFLLLAVIRLAVQRARPSIRVALDVLILITTTATLVGWNGIGRPNPQGLGNIAVVLEVALIVLTVADLLVLRRRRSAS